MKRIHYLTIILALLCAGSLFSQNPNLGTSGAQFLKIPIGAQATALGGAVISLTDDAQAIFWNPAGISHIKNHSLHFSQMHWFEVFNVSAASYAYNAGQFGTLAIGILSFGMDRMEVTTETAPNGTGLYFDAQDIAIMVGYARNLTERFRVGITGKYISQRIWNETASGIAFDVGTQYQLPFKNLTIAMSMRNFGPDLKMSGPDLKVNYDGDPQFTNRLVPTVLETEEYPLPLLFEFGIAMDIFRSRFSSARLGVDAVHPNDNSERIHLGVEMGFYDMLFLRGGYKFNHDDELYNLGFGVQVALGSVKTRFDYAYSGFDILPNVHTFSLGLDF